MDLLYMGKKGFFATLIAILILVFLLFPSSTGKEHILIPERILDLENPSSIIKEDAQGAVSFSLGEYFGYFTESLDLTYIDKVDFHLSATGDNRKQDFLGLERGRSCK